MAIVQNKSGVAGNANYASNYATIFGTDEERKARHAKEKEAENLLCKEIIRANTSARINGSFTPFISPVDGKPVTSRAELNAHNERHGVTDMRDYGEAYFERKRESMDRERLGNTPQAKRERQQLIEKTLYDHGVLRP